MRWLVAGGLSLVVACSLYRPAMRGLAAALAADDVPPARVDFICLAAGRNAVIEGLAVYRNNPGCQFLLFPQRRNRLIDLGVTIPSELGLQELLQNAHVSSQHILFGAEPVASDWELADRLSALLQAHPRASVLILCDQFSGRRLRRIVDATVPDEIACRIRVRSVVDSDQTGDAWWQTKAGSQRVFHGCLGLLFAVVHGRESAPPEDSSPAAYEAALLKRIERSRQE